MITRAVPDVRALRFPGNSAAPPGIEHVGEPAGRSRLPGGPPVDKLPPRSPCQSHFTLPSSGAVSSRGSTAATYERFEGHRSHYASRDLSKAESFRQRFRGTKSYGNYTVAIDDSAVDAV